MRIHTSAGRRNLWISEETAAQLERLGVVNLSAYVRRKVQEDSLQSSPLKALRAELEAKRDEVHRLEEIFETKAVETEDVLRLFEKAAGQARNVISHKDSKVSAQTSLLLWVRNHPTAAKLREVLPKEFSEQQLADVLLRWPESKPEVQVLLEASA